MKIIYSDTVPAWFKLGLSPDQLSLHIHIAKAFIQSQRPIPPDAPIVTEAAKAFSDTLFTRFLGDLSGPAFGFGTHVRNCGEHPAQKEFVSFQVLLPRIRVNTSMACKKCSGTKEREGLPCFFCDGTGKERVYDWNTAFEIVTNLWMLFMYLGITPEGEMPTKVPQWMTLTLLAERGQHGSSLGGDLSKDGVEVLSAIAASSSECEKVETKLSSILTKAWEFMLGRREYDLHDLRAEIRETPNLFLTVPGDAAGVYTENQTDSRGRGCKIGCHNMDSPAQSLTTLWALAGFADELTDCWLNNRRGISRT